MNSKFILYGTIVFFILLTVYSFPIPFFWDGTFFSELSVHFFENGFKNLVAPTNIDSGGFPFYSVYLTLIWKLFGKSLVVSHLALLPFLIGIAFEYFKLSKRFLSKQFLLFSALLLIAEPSFITQSILMGYDIIMIYFFFFALNSLLNRKPNLYSISLVLLCLSSIRGIMLAVALLFIDFILNKQKTLSGFRSYFLSLLFIIGWAIYHYTQTGWFLFSPVRENTHEALLTFPMMLRQLIFIVWKISDFGRILLWLFFITMSIYFLKKTEKPGLKIILIITFIPLIVLSMFMIPLANPVGQKYFICVFLTLNIGVCFLLQQLKNEMIRLFIFAGFIISLTTGNFWLYPERYGNGWDASLKVLPYFHLKDEMDNFITNEKIDRKEVGTQYPLIADKRFSHLSDSYYSYTNVWSGPINNFHYFLQTNVINTDIPEQVEEVKHDWKLLKGCREGMVYISLFKNSKWK